VALREISIMQIEVIKGDITKIKVDAIVNAANSSLMGGGGVDGAIHRAGGPAILEECKKIVAKQGGCPTGEAVITTAGNLPATFVIHTVGPIWNGGHQGEKKLLADCYENSLQLAVANNCKTVAFPNISTGVYRFPKEEAATIAVKTVNDFLEKTGGIEKVIFVCFDEENYRLIQKEVRSNGSNVETFN
jgi:O-acetyl-ADP-ribose deacetylase (regulator of RNase III)